MENTTSTDALDLALSTGHFFMSHECDIRVRGIHCTALMFCGDTYVGFRAVDETACELRILDAAGDCTDSIRFTTTKYLMTPAVAAAFLAAIEALA